MTKLRTASLTDIGRMRSENEDELLYDEKSQIFGVADGVGGLPGGAEAARETTRIIRQEITSQPANAPLELTRAVHRANDAVIALGRVISPATGIASTLTFGCVRDQRMYLAHVGDSRCYLLRDGNFSRVTEDHSVENDAKVRRARGEVVHYLESNRHALSRCIGQPTPPDVDLATNPLMAGDRYLFCTDGVTRMIGDRELGTLLGQPIEPFMLIERIVKLAVNRGGPDNATGVVVMVDAA
jgi:protein phosphatase